MLSRFFKVFRNRNSKGFPTQPHRPPGVLQVTSDGTRCVQCGICGYNCPVGIEVREYARRGQNVTDSRCLACGTCVEKCPRGTLKWGPAILLHPDNRLEISPDELPVMLQLKSRELL